MDDINKSSKIVSAKLERKNIVLNCPYVLSFNTLTSFDTIFLYLTLNTGEILTGEVVPLKGYSNDTAESIMANIKSWLPNILYLSVSEARKKTSDYIKINPCASSLILSALDFNIFQNRDVFYGLNFSIPLVYPVSSMDTQIANTVNQAIFNGYQTIKIKLGQDIEKDINILTKLESLITKGIKFRFDINQAYNYETAIFFLKMLEEKLFDSTELVEQPLLSHQWEEMLKLCQEIKVPLMLDESIYSKEDVAHAAHVGCKYIKLKLYKQGGVKEIIQIAQYANTMGLKVVIGNGVATDISNYLELQTYNNFSDLFYGACESNGFLKLKSSIYYENLKVRLGNAIYENLSWAS